jgi:hypothetical protein
LLLGLLFVTAALLAAWFAFCHSSFTRSMVCFLSQQLYSLLGLPFVTAALLFAWFAFSHSSFTRGMDCF